MTVWSPRVLVVDDSRLTRTIIKNALAGAGYDIVGEAVNGQEGIEMAARLKPDLVTVDITMPEKSGLESLDELREKNPAGKVILVTALGSQKLLQEDAKKAGVLAMINKPFNPFELVRVADRLLGRKGLPSPEPKSLVLPAGKALSGGAENTLTRDQLDDLMEVGNIGAGNAASRLSDLIQERCFISTPQVAFLKPEEVLKTFAPDDYYMVSLGIKILGDIPAMMVVVLHRDQARSVLKYMTRGAVDASAGKDLSAEARAVLKQVGELLTRAFSQAVNQFLLDHSQGALPETAVPTDSLEDLESLLNQSLTGDDASYLLIHCGFSDVDKTFEGKLAYVLSPLSQRTVLDRLRNLLV